jgi:hypothetical protein
VEESLVLQRQLRERFGLAYNLDALGQLATAEGHYAEARAALRESLRLRQEMVDRSGVAESLESIAAQAAAEMQPERAVQLAGAAAGVRQATGVPLSPLGRALLDSWLVPLQQVLGKVQSSWPGNLGETCLSSERWIWHWS